MNIVVLDGHALNPGDLSWGALEALGHLKVYERTATHEVALHAADAEIVLTNKSILNAETLAALPKLKYIGVMATGYNVVDLKAASQQGIVVTNIPAYSTPSVAQMVFALLLTVTQRPEHYTEQVRQGKWSAQPDFCYWDTPLIELSGKRMGILGFGHTGRAVARIAAAFEMEVWAVTSKAQTELPEYVHKHTWAEVLKACHVISLHCPLCEDTHHIINEEALKNIRPDAILINTGRGPLIDEHAVAQALENGRLGAFAADVLTEEPPTNSPLFSSPNTFLTPHIAWGTREARTRLMNICIENIKAFLNGNPQNVVNAWTC